jgi:hypothetical protein
MRTERLIALRCTSFDPARRAGRGDVVNHRGRTWIVSGVIAACVAVAGCSSDDENRNDAAPRSTTAPPSTTTTVAAEERVTVSGNATLDGEPLDADFLGAVVRKDGLVTPCQADLPRVDDGAYEVPVLGKDESAGCGTAGADVLLWAYVGDTQYFATAPTPWPDDAPEATFDAEFSTKTPNGDITPRTEIAAEIFEKDGSKVDPGARVEAYIGDTLCGVASVRRNGDFTGVSLSVVGPDAIPECARNGTVTFRVDDRPIETTIVNRFRPYRNFRLEVA